MTWPHLTCPCAFMSDPPPRDRSNPSRKGSPLAPRRGVTGWRGTFGGARTRSPCRAFPEAAPGAPSARTFGTAWRRRRPGSPRRSFAKNRAGLRRGSGRCADAPPVQLRRRSAAGGRAQETHRGACVRARPERRQSAPRPVGVPASARRDGTGRQAPPQSRDRAPDALGAEPVDEERAVLIAREDAFDLALPITLGRIPRVHRSRHRHRVVEKRRRGRPSRTTAPSVPATERGDLAKARCREASTITQTPSSPGAIVIDRFAYKRSFAVPALDGSGRPGAVVRIWRTFGPSRPVAVIRSRRRNRRPMPLLRPLYRHRVMAGMGKAADMPGVARIRGLPLSMFNRLPLRRWVDEREHLAQQARNPRNVG